MACGRDDDIILNANTDPEKIAAQVARAEIQPRLDREAHSRLKPNLGAIGFELRAWVVDIKSQPMRRRMRKELGQELHCAGKAQIPQASDQNALSLTMNIAQPPIPEVRFSDRQEDALLKNRDWLTTFWQFTIERKSIDEIARNQAVGAGEIRKRLQSLVSLELVSQRRGQFVPKFPRKFRWPDSSRLAAQLNQDWSLLTLKRALKQGSHRLISLRLTPESAREFKARLAQLFDETVREAEREEISAQGLGDSMALFAVSSGSVFSPK